MMVKQLLDILTRYFPDAKPETKSRAIGDILLVAGANKAQQDIAVNEDLKMKTDFAESAVRG